MAKEWTQEEEAERLHARFDCLKADQGIGQAEFARLHNVPGGASMVSQHIKGRRPINLEAALVYAAGFGVSLSEISPRLANEVARAHVAIDPADPSQERPPINLAKQRDAIAAKPWPFPRIDYDKLAALHGADARFLENAILAAAGDLDLDIRVARRGKRASA